MIIAIDYDDTYTRDPVLWDAFIQAAKVRGHTVLCVTMRYERDGYQVVASLGEKVDKIVFTGRKAKRPFMYKLGYDVSVWIDDSPNWILTDALA